MSQSDNFIYLTFALVLLLLCTALAQQFFDESMQHLVQSATIITLLVAVWGVKSDKYLLRKAFIFPACILLVASLSTWLDEYGFNGLHLILMLVFFILTAYKTAHQVLFTGKIDGNKILGAICLYFLMGLIWAILFTLMQAYSGNSFTNSKTTGEWYLLFPDFVYFSFVSLTTLGFGDISPISPIARFLVYLEAIFGQFYLAILVASLVGSKMSEKTTDIKERHE